MAQLFSQGGGLLCFLLILSAGLSTGHVHGLAQLLQHIFLFGFIGVELQAEGGDSNGVQTLLDDLQGSHFLCHKKYGLSFCQGIGDQGGDGLGISRAGRPVEDKTLPACCCPDGVELGGVCAKRQKHVVLRNGFFQRHGLRVPADLSLHQTADNLILYQLMGAVAHVVPHDKLGEGENAQIGGLQHVPSLLCHDGFTHHRKYLAGVDAVFVLGQGIQAADLDAEILAEFFQQGDVHLGIIVPKTDHIAPVSASAHQLHGQKDQGRVAGFCAAGCLIPAQQAQVKEFALPKLFFGDGNAAFSFPHFYFLPHFAGRICQLVLVHLLPLNLPAGLRPNPQGQGGDAAVPGSGYVDDALNRVVAYQFLPRRCPRVVK